MCRELIDYIDKRSVLILGFGREGRSSLAFIRRHLPEKKVAVADRSPQSIDDKNVEIFAGEGYLDKMKDFDLVLKAPGVSLKGVALPAKTEITCQTDLFLRFAPCMKIGVTGTKGKTTTSTLIYNILCAAEIPACLIGNMGFPVFDSIEDISGKTAVIEMSSHQLEFCRTSPHIAVLTNVFEEHLDHYNSFAGYIAAKLNIVRYQTETDVFIRNADQSVAELAGDLDIRSKIKAVSASDGKNSEFLDSLTKINERLIGSHNGQDIFFAAKVAEQLGISREAVRRGVESFKGIDHRMEPVGTYHGIKFFNDCIATIPRAVLCALDALHDVDTLIIGGKDRGLDYSEFIAELEKSGVRNIICLPDTGHRTGHIMLANGTKKNIVIADSMEEAVDAAFELTQRGKTCLLSPAAASYNKYKDFEEKGNHYMSLVRSRGQ